MIVAEGLPPHVPSYAARVIEKSGYGSIPFKFVNLEDEPGKVVEVDSFAGSPVVERIVVPEILMDEDTSVINVPKLKTHLMVMFTGAIKNVAMGMVNQYTKSKIHETVGHNFKKLSRALVEVYLALKETIPLTVVDAVESMSGNGPTHGEKLSTGKIIYGKDAAVVDLILGEVMGMREAPVPTVLTEYGLTPNLRDIEVVGNLKTFEFQPPSTYRSGLDARVDSILDSENWLSIRFSSFFIGRSWYNLKINQELCGKCGGCYKRCPSEAILQQSEAYTIDGSKCVRCLCCKEMCPNDAVEITRPLSGRFMNLSYKMLTRLGLF